jgi:hypothetical protein
MPSGKMFLGASLFTSFLDSSWGAVGADEVKAGAILIIDSNSKWVVDLSVDLSAVRVCLRRYLQAL